MARHEVVVGNLGTVYRGDDIAKARQTYMIYLDISQNCEHTRTYGEPVTRLVDGEIVQESKGTQTCNE